MDLASLEALGITKADLIERIVEKAVSELMESHGFDEDGDERTYESQFKHEINKRIQAAVDAKITALANEHLVPRVGEMIEAADMRQTNRYGEPESPPMTFKEYIASRAEVYMSEEVDINGLSKAEQNDYYNWRSCGPRLTVLMRLYIKDTLEKNAKAAVNNVNEAIAKGLQKAATEAIAAAAANLKVAVSA